jgi:hypothetical protein
MPSLLPALIQCLILYGISQIRMPENLFDLALHGAISFAAYAIAFRLLSLTAEERGVACQWQSELLPRLRVVYRERLARANLSDPVASLPEETC